MSLYMTTTADACVATTVNDCLNGTKIESPKDTSWEQLYYQTGIAEPRARVMINDVRPLNPVVAVARFVWLVAGNNRVEDIAFYEPKVRNFSDDGLTVPGSDYGMRLFQPRPGLNQLQGVVDKLRQDPYSRQACSVVWQPEDAVRQSKDIPCTFGMFFHLRKAYKIMPAPELFMNVTMRSNNAFRILPFNIFEFTMLQELVATELGVPLGAYHHWAASMHVYENEREWEPTKAIAQSVVENKVPWGFRMDEMPADQPMQQAFTMAMFEAQLRHVCTRMEFEDVMANALQILAPYWFGLLSILACYIAARHGWDPHYADIPERLRDMAAATIQKV